MNRAAKLRAARAIVLEVIKTLNTTHHPCEACGLKKHENWDEAQIETQLSATSRKLDELQARLHRLDSAPRPV